MSGIRKRRTQELGCTRLSVVVVFVLMTAARHSARGHEERRFLVQTLHIDAMLMEARKSVSLSLEMRVVDLRTRANTGDLVQTRRRLQARAQTNRADWRAHFSFRNKWAAYGRGKPTRKVSPLVPLQAAARHNARDLSSLSLSLYNTRARANLGGHSKRPSRGTGERLTSAHLVASDLRRCLWQAAVANELARASQDTRTLTRSNCKSCTRLRAMYEMVNACALERARTSRK